MPHTRLELVVEENIAVATLPLRLVHRAVGVVEQGFRTGMAGVRGHGYADAGSHEHPPRRPRDGGAEVFPYPIRYCDDVGFIVDVVTEDCELVAAEPRHRIPGTNRPLQASS